MAPKQTPPLALYTSFRIHNCSGSDPDGWDLVLAPGTDTGSDGLFPAVRVRPDGGSRLFRSSDNFAETVYWRTFALIMIMVINMKTQQSIRYVFTERTKDYVYTEGDRGRLRKDIRSFLAGLADYRINLRSLSERQVDSATRNQILNIALTLINDAAIAQELVRDGQLPTARAAERTGYPEPFVKEYAEYIIAYMLLFGTEQHSFLSRQLSIGTKLDGTAKPVRRDQGIKLKDLGFTSVVLTPYGEFRYLDPRDRHTVAGDFITGNEPIVKPRRAMILGAAAGALLLFFTVFAYSFYQPVRSFTVMSRVEASFSFNRYGRLVEAQGLNNSGRKVLVDLVYSDKKVDSTLALFLDESIDLEYLDRSSELTLVVMEGSFSREELSGQEILREVRENDLRIKVNQGDGNGFILSP